MIYVAASLALCMCVVASVAINRARREEGKALEMFRQLVRQQETLCRALKDNVRLKAALAPFAAKPWASHEPDMWADARAALQPDNLVPATIEALSKLGQ